MNQQAVIAPGDGGLALFPVLAIAGQALEICFGSRALARKPLFVSDTQSVSRLIFHTVRAIADADARPVWDPAGLEEVRALTR